LTPLFLYYLNYLPIKCTFAEGVTPGELFFLKTIPGAILLTGSSLAVFLTRIQIQEMPHFYGQR